MKALLLGAAFSAAVFTSPGQAQNIDNYLFGYSNGSHTRQLSLTTLSDTIVLSADDSGSYDQGGMHIADNSNYNVGRCDSCEKSIYHHYFTFNLSGITSTVTSATLTAFNP
jgi:hypothetical protein